MDSTTETNIDIMTILDCMFNSSYSHAWMKDQLSGLLDLTKSNIIDDQFILQFVYDEDKPHFHSSITQHFNQNTMKRLLNRNQQINHGIINAIMETLAYKRSLHTYSQTVFFS